MSRYSFTDVKKVMRQFSGVTNKTARKELEELVNNLFHGYDMKAGEIIELINKSMRIALLNEGVEKE